MASFRPSDAAEAAPSKKDKRIKRERAEQQAGGQSSAPANASVNETAEKPPKEKKAKQPKVAYPGLNTDADGKTTTRLKEWPADYDPRVHNRLRRKDFENEAPFLIKRAERLEDKAKKLREEAAIVAAGGTTTEQKKMKKLTKAAGQFAELMGELKDELTPEQLEEFKKMFAGVPQAAVAEEGKA